jgi:hypothetical protein
LKPIAPPSFCETTGDVMKGSVYVKSFCVDSSISTYQEAKDNCEANGMRLYQLSSPEATDAILAYANDKLKTFTDVAVFVDGKTGTECSVISNSGGSFKNEMKDCTSVIQNVCEYKKI